jgi:hypothetical protein
MRQFLNFGNKFVTSGHIAGGNEGVHKGISVVHQVVEGLAQPIYGAPRFLGNLINFT